MITADVFKSSVIGDCTNGGCSATAKRVLVWDPKMKPLLTVDEIAAVSLPILKVVRRMIQGKEYLHLEPLGNPEQGRWMAGGNFAYTSDSRFPHDYPLSIHDRSERGL